MKNILKTTWFLFFVMLVFPGINYSKDNLLSNPGFLSDEKHNPKNWHLLNNDDHTSFIKSSDSFKLRHKGHKQEKKQNCIGIKTTHGLSAAWVTDTAQCTPGKKYVFSGEFYRSKWVNGKYPEIEIWGKSFLLNTHCNYKTFQKISLNVSCPAKTDNLKFKFINNYPDSIFWLKNPVLKEASLKKHNKFSLPYNNLYKNFFAIGVYGADINNIRQIKKLALNTVIIGGSGKSLQKKIDLCNKINLRYVLAVPRDPGKLKVYLDNLPDINENKLAFYVNDEPGIHGFSVEKANKIQQIIKKQYPLVATCMAILRPQVCDKYINAADFFMLDQYPVPFMPMTWLSDSIEQAKKTVGEQRIISIIQAFGGEKWANNGWPQMPSWSQMDCLAFLSVIHQTKGIFFYSFREIGQTEKGRNKLAKVVGRLNQIYPWLLTDNIQQQIKIKIVSDNKYDYKGREAIHACIKKKDSQLLVILVNVIGTYVESIINISNLNIKNNDQLKIKEVFTHKKYTACKDALRVNFKPYETKAFLIY